MDVAVEGQTILDTLAKRTRTRGERATAAFKAFIADVMVSSNEPGATVFVDDVEVGRTPLSRPLRLDMGPRRFRVEKAGFQRVEESKSLRGGAHETLAVRLLAVVHEGRLRVSADAGATIRVNGKLVGVGDWEGRLPSGVHRVDLSATGRKPWRADSVVRDEQLTTLVVALEPAAQPASGGVPAWVWIAGGTLAAAGLGVGAYVLFQPEDKDPPPPVAGSLATWELPLGLFGR